MARYLSLLAFGQTVVAGSLWDRSVVLSERAAPASANTCDSGTYTTPVGLVFTNRCNSNIPGYDFEFPTSLTAVNMFECMRFCSVKSPGCYGISYNFNDKHCYLKNSSVVGKTVNGGNSVTHSALVSPTSQFTAQDATCPYTDSSTQKTNNGMPYQVSCGKDITDGDYCPPSNGSCPVHASSLSDCMEQCSSSHPLCTGVSYNPGMENGYANCRFKNNFAKAGLVTASYTTHSAVFQLQNITTNCTEDSNVIAANTNIFRMGCNQNRAGNDLAGSPYHEVSLQKCIDNCATYDGSKCVGVIYDGNMELGYENCYLKSTAGVPIYNSTALFALSTGKKDATATSSSSSSGSASTSGSSSGASSGSSSATDSGKSSGGSGSKAWVAGIVVAVIVILSIVAGIIIWRRRKATAAAALAGHGPIVEAGHQEQYYSADPKMMNNGYSPAPTYGDDSIKPSTYAPPVELDDTRHTSELPAHPVQ